MSENVCRTPTGPESPLPVAFRVHGRQQKRYLRQAGQTSQNEQFRAQRKILSASAPERRSGGRERGQGCGRASPSPNFCVLEIVQERNLTQELPIICPPVQSL